MIVLHFFDTNDLEAPPAWQASLVVKNEKHDIQGDKEKIDFSRNVISPRSGKPVAAFTNEFEADLEEWARALMWNKAHSQQVGDLSQMVLIQYDDNPYSAEEIAEWSANSTKS